MSSERSARFSISLLPLPLCVVENPDFIVQISSTEHVCLSENYSVARLPRGLVSGPFFPLGAEELALGSPAAVGEGTSTRRSALPHCSLAGNAFLSPFSPSPS